MSIDERALRDCCGSERWQELMRSGLASPSDGLQGVATDAFDSLSRADWLQAFAAHSPIGMPRAGDHLGASEQAGVQADDGDVVAALAAGNVEYQNRFGFVFLIRARGRSAQEILVQLRTRLDNAPEVEFANACEQQREITAQRLKEFGEPPRAASWR